MTAKPGSFGRDALMGIAVKPSKKVPSHSLQQPEPALSECRPEAKVVNRQSWIPIAQYEEENEAAPKVGLITHVQLGPADEGDAETFIWPLDGRKGVWGSNDRSGFRSAKRRLMS